jgi:hypothetical protein
MLEARSTRPKARRMSRPATRWIAARIMLVVLCLAVATILSPVVIGIGDVRNEQAQGLIFAAIFAAALVTGLVRFPLDKRS